MRLWRIAADTPAYEAHDLSGKGAESTGGRWNRAGRPAVYASGTVALAALETFVHLNAHALPLNRFLVAIDVPPSVWQHRRVFRAQDLPVGWTATPEGVVTLDAGDAWLREARCAVLVVPSVVVPEEWNVVINPLHPQARRIKARKVRPWHYDRRMR